MILNKIEELDYKLLPFKYLGNTIGSIIVRSENEANDIIKALSECIQEINNNNIKLTNGSVITIIKSKSNVIRGKKVNAVIHYDNFG